MQLVVKGHTPIRLHESDLKIYIIKKKTKVSLQKDEEDINGQESKKSLSQKRLSRVLSWFVKKRSNEI